MYGTFREHGSTVKVKLTDQSIIIYDRDDNEIASYKLHWRKGKLVSNSNFKRDYSSKIDELI